VALLGRKHWGKEKTTGSEKKKTQKKGKKKADEGGGGGLAIKKISNPNRKDRTISQSPPLAPRRGEKRTTEKVEQQRPKRAGVLRSVNGREQGERRTNAPDLGQKGIGGPKERWSTQQRRR